MPWGTSALVTLAAAAATGLATWTALNAAFPLRARHGGASAPCAHAASTAGRALQELPGAASASSSEGFPPLTIADVCPRPRRALSSAARETSALTAILVPIPAGQDARKHLESWAPRARAGGFALLGACARCNASLGVVAEERELLPWGVSYPNTWNVTRAALLWGASAFPAARWFLLMESSTYVFPDRLYEWLATLPSENKVYYAGNVVAAKRSPTRTAYVAGAGGVVLSRAALERAGRMSEGACAFNSATDRPTKSAELVLARCLASLGVNATHDDAFLPFDVATTTCDHALRNATLPAYLRRVADLARRHVPEELWPRGLRKPIALRLSAWTDEYLAAHWAAAVMGGVG